MAHVPESSLFNDSASANAPTSSLFNDSSSQPPPPPPSAPPENADEPPPSGRGKLIFFGASGLVVLLLIAGGWFMWSNYQDREPARVVEAFLESVKDGDVDDALTYLDTSPDSRSAYFLRGDALDNGWDIDEVSLRSRDSSSILGDTASVTASITGPGDTQAQHIFGLTETNDGDWLISEGLTTMRVNFNQLPLIEINGFSPDIGPGAGNGVEFYMLPGLYSFYTEGIDVVEPALDQQLFLGNNVQSIGDKDEVESLPDYATRVPLPQHMRLKDDARETMQAKVEEYLDDCVEDIDGSELAGCPMGLETEDLQEALDSSETDFDDFEWEIQDYPQVNVHISDDPSQNLEVSLETSEPGTIELTVSAGGSDSTLECPLPATFITPHFDMGGEIYLGPRESRDQLERNDEWESAHEDWTDCQEA